MMCGTIAKYGEDIFARYWNGLRHVDSGECSLFRESLEIWSVAPLLLKLERLRFEASTRVSDECKWTEW